jgi:hypothetical protein
MVEKMDFGSSQRFMTEAFCSVAPDDDDDRDIDVDYWMGVISKCLGAASHKNAVKVGIRGATTGSAEGAALIKKLGLSWK